MSGPRPAVGVPGIYRSAQGPRFALAPERLDVAGFVGVAPRGPVDVPTAVHSWPDYQWRFGGFEGPGLLPHAVRTFFAQGGEHAYVLRVSPVPRCPDPAAVAAHEMLVGAADTGTAPAVIGILARDEGSWGMRLRVRWDFEVTRRFAAHPVVPGPDGEALIDLPDGARVPPFSLLRLCAPGLPRAGVFAWAGAAVERRHGGGGRCRAAAVAPAGLWAGADDDPVGALRGPVERLHVGVVTVTVTVTDDDPAQPRQERFDGLGLRAEHSRFVREVLARDSLLIRPAGDWPEAILPPDPLLTPAQSRPAWSEPVVDRWADIIRASFAGDIDPDQLPVGGLDEAGETGPIPGMDRMSLEQQIGLLAVPDLFWSFARQRPTVEITPPRPSDAFVPCVRLDHPDPPVVTYPPPPAEILLDARTELKEILWRQRRLVALAERQRRFVALLDVPPNLTVPQIARWRAEFASSYAAAYHPWLGIVDAGDPDGRARAVPPSAFAAGIVADRELRLGLPWGPANALAAGAVLAVEPVSDTDHEALFALGVNVFRLGPDGWRLTSARTLSTDPDYLQLSVRRLMTMLGLVLRRQVQWLVFEPHTPQLRSTVRDVVVQLLRRLFRAGAFAGAGEEEAFFVRCDESLNPAWSQEQGRLVVEVGVAPARPLEFIVLRIALDTQGALEEVTLA